MTGALAILIPTALAFSVEESPPTVPGELLYEAVQLRCAAAAQDHQVWLQAGARDAIAVVITSPSATSTRELPLAGLEEADRVRAAALVVCETAEHTQLASGTDYAWDALRPVVAISLSTGRPQAGARYHIAIGEWVVQATTTLRDNSSLVRDTLGTRWSEHQPGLTGALGVGHTATPVWVAGGELGLEVARGAGGPLVFTSAWTERSWKAWTPRFGLELGQASVQTELEDGTRVSSRGLRGEFIVSVAWRGPHV